MTTITLNNENKTQIEFTYNNGLPYKKSITPEYEYGNWKENNQIALIQIKLSEYEVSLFSNKGEIFGKSIYGFDEKIWIDLEDVYLVLNSNKYLKEKISNKKFVLVFLYNNEILSSWGYTK